MSNAGSAPPGHDPPPGLYRFMHGSTCRWLTLAQILELTTPRSRPVTPLLPLGASYLATAALLESAAKGQQEDIQQLLNDPIPERPSVTLEQVLARMKELEDEC